MATIGMKNDSKERRKRLDIEEVVVKKTGLGWVVVRETGGENFSSIQRL